MSRCLRSPVEAGSIEYSAVTHPLPRPANQRGTEVSTEAVQITRVVPAEIRAEPSAVSTKPGSIRIGRSSWSARSWLREALIVAAVSQIPSPARCRRNARCRGSGRCRGRRACTCPPRPPRSPEGDLAHGLRDLLNDQLGQLGALTTVESGHSRNHPDHQQRDQEDQADVLDRPLPSLADQEGPHTGRPDRDRRVQVAQQRVSHATSSNWISLTPALLGPRNRRMCAGLNQLSDAFETKPAHSP